MRKLFILGIAAVGLLAATEASARMSDQEFIRANRCAGLIGSAALDGGPQDTAEIEAKLRTEANSRPGFVADMGERARSSASREARHASAERKARLVAERDGVCRAYLQQP